MVFDNLPDALEFMTLHPVNRQVELLPDINSHFNSNIVVKAIPPEASLPEERYNCFRYALNLANSVEYINRIKSINFEFHTGVEFMEYLLEKGVLNCISIRECCDNDIVIYFNNDRPSHAGKYYSGRIISKWGTDLLVEHNINEVPISYGITHKYFSNPEEAEMVEMFKKYIEIKTIS